VITVVRKVPHVSALMYRLASDLTWAMYGDPKNGMNVCIGLPWSVFESMACGTPVITWEGTYRAHLLKRLGCGLAVDGNCVSCILESVGMLSRDPGMQQRLSSNAKSASLLQYNWEHMSQTLIEAYGRLRAAHLA
jgi:glycosyltransferase involved in cell wall biosynthesis